MDVEVQAAARPRLFFDVTVRHGTPGAADRLRAAAVRDGAVNAEAEADKKARYPDGVTPWEAVPVAVETYGRFGRAALRHLKTLARAEVAKLGGDEVWGVHALLQRWCSRLSVALHRANARAIRCALGHRDARRAWAER